MLGDFNHCALESSAYSLDHTTSSDSIVNTTKVDSLCYQTTAGSPCVRTIERIHKVIQLPLNSLCDMTSAETLADTNSADSITLMLIHKVIRLVLNQ